MNQAARAGATEEALANDRSIVNWGLDQNRKRGRIHRFEHVRVGGESFDGMALAVADVHIQEAGMMLGADFARRRRIWLSYATRQMFVVPPALAGTPP